MYFRCHLSISEIGRKISVSRSTVRKCIRDTLGEAPQYTRTPKEKIIKPFEAWLLQALETDSALPKRNRRTALALFDEIQKQGFTGSYSRVTEFLNDWRKSGVRVTSSFSHWDEITHWMKWLYSIEQPHRVPSNAEVSAGLCKIYDVLAPSPNSPRTKALVVLANLEGFSISHIARCLAISRKTVQGYLAAFQAGGESELFKGKSRLSKSHDLELKKCIFALLHEPPSLHGFNRTTWRMDDLQVALNKSGHLAGEYTIRKVIKEAGFRWKSAKIVLTSTDPEYREKYQHIQDILSSLRKP